MKIRVFFLIAVISTAGDSFSIKSGVDRTVKIPREQTLSKTVMMIRAEKNDLESTWVTVARKRFEPTDMPTAAPTLVGLLLLSGLLYGLVLPGNELLDFGGESERSIVNDAMTKGSKVAEAVSAF